MIGHTHSTCLLLENYRSLYGDEKNGIWADRISFFVVILYTLAALGVIVRYG